MVESSKPIVLITGVSGYLGSHVALVFLKDGNFTVRGTVRDTKNEKKILPLKKAFGELFDKLTLVEADLENKESIFNAVKGANFVVHTASPFPLKAPKTEAELINPAVNGTLAVMEASHANKVKRVVITSSIAAIMAMRTPPENWTFSEQNWSDPTNPDIQAYVKSKTLAEKAAWDFLKALPEHEKFELVTINPGFIIGPAFVGAGFTSGEIIENLILGKFPALPKVSFGCVDVRDCAVAHLQGLIKPEAANKRFMLVKDTMWMTDIASVLSNEFKTKGYTSIKTGELPKWIASMASWFVSELAFAMKIWGIDMKFNNDQSRQILGIEYSIPLEKSVIEMAYSMIETGVLPDKRPKL